MNALNRYGPLAGRILIALIFYERDTEQ